MKAITLNLLFACFVHLCLVIPVGSSLRKLDNFRTKRVAVTSKGNQSSEVDKLVLTIPEPFYIVDEFDRRPGKRGPQKYINEFYGSTFKANNSSTALHEIPSSSQDNLYYLDQNGGSGGKELKDSIIPGASSSFKSTFDPDEGWSAWYKPPAKFTQSISYGYQAGDKDIDIFPLYGPPKSHQSLTLFRTPEYEADTKTYWPPEEPTTPSYDLPGFHIPPTPYFPYRPPTIPYTTTSYANYSSFTTPSPNSTHPYVEYGPPTTPSTTFDRITDSPPTTTPAPTTTSTTIRTTTTRRSTIRPTKRVLTTPRPPRTTAVPRSPKPPIRRATSTLPPVISTPKTTQIPTTNRVTVPRIKFTAPTTPPPTTPFPITEPTIQSKIYPITTEAPPEYETEPPINFGPSITPQPPTRRPREPTTALPKPPPTYGVPKTTQATVTNTTMPSVTQVYSEYGVPGQEPGNPLAEYIPTTSQPTVASGTYGVPGHTAGEPLGEYEPVVERRVQNNRGKQKLINAQSQASPVFGSKNVATPALYFLPPPLPTIPAGRANFHGRRQPQPSILTTTTTEEPSLWSLFGF